MAKSQLPTAYSILISSREQSQQIVQLIGISYVELGAFNLIVTNLCQPFSLFFNALILLFSTNKSAIVLRKVKQSAAVSIPTGTLRF